VGVSADKIAAHNIPDAIPNSQSRPDCIQTNPQRHLEVTHLVEQCRVQDHKDMIHGGAGQAGGCASRREYKWDREKGKMWERKNDARSR
jgi:hypothetical protein